MPHECPCKYIVCVALSMSRHSSRFPIILIRYKLKLMWYKTLTNRQSEIISGPLNQTGFRVEIQRIQLAEKSSDLQTNIWFFSLWDDILSFAVIRDAKMKWFSFCSTIPAPFHKLSKMFCFLWFAIVAGGVSKIIFCCIPQRNRPRRSSRSLSPRRRAR